MGPLLLTVLVGLYSFSAADGTECNVPLISGPHAVADSQLTASTIYDHRHNTALSRLNTVARNGYTGAWCSKPLGVYQWIQVDLRNVKHVISVATRGRQDWSGWVTNYTVMYSMDGESWTTYTESGKTKIFLGNWDRDYINMHHLQIPFDARMVRLAIKGWHRHICMRWEIFGCSLPDATCPYGFGHFFSHGRSGTVFRKPYRSSCYKFVRTPSNWLDARKRCTALGADLVSIETAGEQHHLEHVIKTHPNYQTPALPALPYLGHWTSGTDKVKEGHWQWAATERPIDYTNWFPGQPRKHSNHGQHCQAMVPGPSKYRWHDTSCASFWYMYICEKTALLQFQ